MNINIIFLPHFDRVFVDKCSFLLVIMQIFDAPLLQNGHRIIMDR